jgi:hypothetical protein
MSSIYSPDGSEKPAAKKANFFVKKEQPEEAPFRA